MHEVRVFILNIYLHHGGMPALIWFNPGILNLSNRQAKWVMIYREGYCFFSSDLTWDRFNCLSCYQYFNATLSNYSGCCSSRN